MGLHQNGFRDNVGVFRYAGLTASNGCVPSALAINTALTGSMRNITAGGGITSEKVGIPSGAKHPIAWLMPQKTGVISSHHLARGEATAVLLLVSGINIAGSSAGATTQVEATGGLVVSMTVTPTGGSSTVEGTLKAALEMTVAANGGSSTVSGTMTAKGWLYGESDGSCTVTLTSYARGFLYGSISSFTTLSPESLANSVWNSLVASYAEDGTMGKALGVASTGGVDLDLMAQAVLDAAVITPIHSEVKKVNGVTVSGTGVYPSDPWGPSP